MAMLGGLDGWEVLLGLDRLSNAFLRNVGGNPEGIGKAIAMGWAGGRFFSAASGWRREA
jgi:hypothetical protein